MKLKGNSVPDLPGFGFIEMKIKPKFHRQDSIVRDGLILHPLQAPAFDDSPTESW